MNRTPLLAVGLLLSSFASAVSFDAFDQKVADLTILQAREIQNEVGINASMRDRLNGIVKRNNDALQAYIAEEQKKGVDPRKDTTVQRRINSFGENMKTEVLGALTASQIKRLREITLQVTGLRALTDDTVATRCGLSSKELTSARNIFNAARSRVKSLVDAKLAPIQKKYQSKKPTSQEELDVFQANYNLEAKKATQSLTPKVKQIQNETEAKIKAAVSAKALATFRSLQGAPSAAASKIRNQMGG